MYGSFFFSSRRRHTRLVSDWSSDVCSSDLYDIRIENRKTGAGVRISGDRPLSKVVFWSIRSVACPEPYVELRIEPAQERSEERRVGKECSTGWTRTERRKRTKSLTTTKDEH